MWYDGSCNISESTETDKNQQHKKNPFFVFFCKFSLINFYNPRGRNTLDKRKIIKNKKIFYLENNWKIKKKDDLYNIFIFVKL